jgi:hypothetical protein
LEWLAPVALGWLAQACLALALGLALGRT